MKGKYICNDCGHQFNLRSYLKDCEKCQSKNIKKQGESKKRIIFLLLALSIIGVLGYLFKDSILKNSIDAEIDLQTKYISFDYEIEDGNSVRFKLVTNKYDTIYFDDNLHSNFNFKCTDIEGEMQYEFNDGLIYPCKSGVRFSWDFDTLIMDMSLEQAYSYIFAEDFKGFEKSPQSKCPIPFRILEVTDPKIDSDCRFFVLTNHPDNIIDSLQIDTNGNTYFTKGEDMIEISISGEDGPYEMKNEFLWNSTLSQNDIWVKSKDNPQPKQWNEPKPFQNCEVIKVNTEGSKSENQADGKGPKEYNEDVFKQEIKEEFQSYLDGSIVDKYDLKYFEEIFTSTIKLNGESIESGFDAKIKIQRDKGLDIRIKSIKVSKKGKQVLGINLTTN